MNVNRVIIARKYARAYFRLYGELFNKATVELLQELIVFIKDNKDLLFYMQSMFIQQALKAEAVHKLIERFELPIMFENLIITLINQKRLFLLADVLEYLVELYRKHNGIIAFKVVSAHPLTDRQLADIDRFLELMTHKTINLSTSIDRSLIVGIKLISNTLQWEYSVQKQLMALKRLA